MTVHITSPLTDEVTSTLKVGDIVKISGVIYTARDAAHKRLVELVANSEAFPFPLEGAIIYYVGPTPAPKGRPIGSAGPTSSYRMDSYAPILMDNGQKAMIGKGLRSQDLIDNMVKNKAVYLAATGGAGALISKTILSSEVVAYPDLGPEAVHKLTVKDFPCVVAIDCKGNSIYEQGPKAYLNSIK